MNYEPMRRNPLTLVIYIALFVFGSIFLHLILRRWYARRVKAAKLISLTFLAFIFSILSLLIGFLHASILGYKYPLYTVTLGIGYSFSMISICFLILFSREIFGFDMKYLYKYLIGALVLAIALLLPNNYYGISNEEQGQFGPSIRLYTSSATLLFSFLIYTRLAIKSFQAAAAVETFYARVGFRSIGLSHICMDLLYLFLGIDVAVFTFDPISEGYTIFATIAWFFALLFLLFAYLGYMLPSYLRRQEIIKKASKNIANGSEGLSQEIPISLPSQNLDIIQKTIFCPVCNQRIALNLEPSFVSKRKKLTKSIINLAVNENNTCGHRFIAYIDKEFQIRGTETLDCLFHNLEGMQKL